MNGDYVKVLVEGKNVNNYIKWLIKNRINIISLNILSHNKLEMVVDYKYYESLFNYSKTYEIKIIKKYGKLRIFEIIKNNRIILSCLIFSIIFLYVLSNMIFSIQVVYNDQEIINHIISELNQYGIRKYRFKKKYLELEKIKEEILDNNKDLFEWIEIEEVGTKYVIKLVERKKNDISESYEYQSIVAKKDAIITEIRALSGEKIREVGEYIRCGDVIVSGILVKPDNSLVYKKAIGNVYGEVWYKVYVEYPLYYQEEKLTGKNKSVISFYLINDKFALFPYKKYKQFRMKSITLLENNFVPVKIAKEKLYEVIIKEDIYTQEEAIQEAINYVKKKITASNSKIVKVNDVKVLDKKNDSSKIILNLFVSVVEDIGIYSEIIPEDNLSTP